MFLKSVLMPAEGPLVVASSRVTLTTTQAARKADAFSLLAIGPLIYQSGIGCATTVAHPSGLLSLGRV